MNTMKKNGGFTLVELIIVIAILAILSTGAIAGYSAYIKSANNAAVEAVLSDISTSAVLANAKNGGIESVVVKENGENIEITVEGVGADFATLFDGSLNATGTTDAQGVYTGTMKKPAAWDNSKYDGKQTTWENSAWGEPVEITASTPADPQG